MKRRGIRKRLPHDYVPEEYTVLCGRGKEYTTSTGNQHLKSLIHKHLKGYSEAPSKVAKSAIVSEIMRKVRSVCAEPTFVKLEDNAWWEVDNAFAREKIGERHSRVRRHLLFSSNTHILSASHPLGCMFRDALHTQYRSSTKAKFARKKATPSTIRRAESVPTIVSIGSSSSVTSRDSSQSYNSALAEEIFGPRSINTNLPEPAPRSAVLHDYGSMFPSFLRTGSPQSRTLNIPINHCIMPLKNTFSVATDGHLLDDFPDDLSGIFDEM
eukprot:scaffold3515_cov126-Cylindrotheca_fusiformis.AAC.31